MPDGVALSACWPVGCRCAVLNEKHGDTPYREWFSARFSALLHVACAVLRPTTCTCCEQLAWLSFVLRSHLTMFSYGINSGAGCCSGGVTGSRQWLKVELVGNIAHLLCGGGNPCMGRTGIVRPMRPFRSDCRWLLLAVACVQSFEPWDCAQYTSRFASREPSCKTSLAHRAERGGLVFL
jgi:hypothetical protein